MSSDYILSLIREMERNGCDLTYQASTESDTHVLTVQYRERRFSVISSGRFDFEEAHARWVEMRTPVTIVHKVKEAPESPRTSETKSKRVDGCRNVPAPRVRENSVVTAPKPVERPRAEAQGSHGGLSLRDRLKARNEQKAGAA